MIRGSPVNLLCFKFINDVGHLVRVHWTKLLTMVVSTQALNADEVEWLAKNPKKDH